MDHNNKTLLPNDAVKLPIKLVINKMINQGDHLFCVCDSL